MSRWYVTYCAAKDLDEVDRADACNMPALAPTHWKRVEVDLAAVVWFVEERDGDIDVTAVRLDTGDLLVLRVGFDDFHDWHKAFRETLGREAA